MTPGDDRRAWRLAVSAVVWAMYGVSLALPVMPEPMQDGEWLLGYEALLISVGFHEPFWPVLANIALLAGWAGYMVRQQTLALVAGIAGVVLSASTVWFLMDPGPGSILHLEQLAELKAGYWTWMAAMVVFAIAAGHEFFTELRRQDQK